MADHHYMSNLEEQLRQDQRLGKARRRKRRIRRFLPLALILILILGLWLTLRPEKEDTPTDETQETAPGASVAELAFVGDISLDQAMLDAFRTAEGYDFSPLFRRVTAQLNAADLTLGNLEGNFDDSAVSSFNYPSALARDLYAAGFDILQTSNSYTIQNGITGLAKTKEAIQAAGMDALGTWSSQTERDETKGVLIREVNGLKFAFLAFTKGMNNLRLPDGADYCVNLLYTDYDTNYTRIDRFGILSAIEAAKSEQPDVIVAMVHWGSEYDEQIADTQREIAELMQDNGVSIIVGSHSHYVGPMEMKTKKLSTSDGSFLAYGLGDFLSVADTTSARNGCILSLRIVKDEDGLRISRVSYTPTFSAAPSQSLETTSYEIFDSLDAISFYQNEYYDRVSQSLYDRMVKAVERMGEQTGMPELLDPKAAK